MILRVATSLVDIRVEDGHSLILRVATSLVGMELVPSTARELGISVVLK